MSLHALEFYLLSETKIEPDLRLRESWTELNNQGGGGGRKAENLCFAHLYILLYELQTKNATDQNHLSGTSGHRFCRALTPEWLFRFNENEPREYSKGVLTWTGTWRVHHSLYFDLFSHDLYFRFSH